MIEKIVMLYIIDERYLFRLNEEIIHMDRISLTIASFSCSLDLIVVRVRIERFYGFDGEADVFRSLSLSLKNEE
jgi:hypothetical protein